MGRGVNKISASNAIARSDATKVSKPRVKEYYDQSLLGVRVKITESRDSKKMVKIYKELQAKKEDLNYKSAKLGGRTYDESVLSEPSYLTVDQLKREIDSLQQQLDSMRVKPKDQIDYEYMNRYDQLLEVKREEALQEHATESQSVFPTPFYRSSFKRRMKEIDNEQLKIRSGAKIIEAESLRGADDLIEITEAKSTRFTDADEDLNFYLR